MVLWDHAHPGIYIEGDAAFVTACGQDLARINANKVGQNLLKLLSKRAQGIGTKAGNIVTIQYTGDLGSVAQNSVDGGKEVRKVTKPGSVVRLPARGDSSLVEYGHDLALIYGAAIGVPTPAYVALAHELIHALHVISGDVVKDYDWSTDGAIIEEARTVGLGPYAKKTISENAIRKENGLTRRTYYSFAGDTDLLVAVT